MGYRDLDLAETSLGQDVAELLLRESTGDAAGQGDHVGSGLGVHVGISYHIRAELTWYRDLNPLRCSRTKPADTRALS